MVGLLIFMSFHLGMPIMERLRLAELGDAATEGGGVAHVEHAALETDSHHAAALADGLEG